MTERCRTIQPTGEPVAVTGMGCRFPGAPNVHAFWELLDRSGYAIQEIPPSRFDAASFYSASVPHAGKLSSRWGGFLSDDQIFGFDCTATGIAPREAAFLDPQQRLLVEVTWEALEDAGLLAKNLSGSQTGVFVGMWLHDFESRLYQRTGDLDFYMTTGSGRYAASGRLSYLFGLQGPSLTVDTACSSSLVAVHLAVQSLRSGECNLAIAGAANVILQPHVTIAYSQSGMMAPDGRCKFGDKNANGYVRSEGGAAIVLKRLQDALKDNDPVHAIILGSAVNNDGRSNGYLTTPSQIGQEELLKKAYRDAGVEPGRLFYVEAHGTGTRAGDPVEIGALAAVMGEGRPPGDVLRVGSVKTNIGHTESAAGLAGLIKNILALRHRTIPKSLFFDSPSEEIPWSRLPLMVQADRYSWVERDRPTVVGVSAFGITGTNAHVVLQEAPNRRSTRSTSTIPSFPGILCLSAHTPAALRRLVNDYLEQFGPISSFQLEDVCYTSAVRRTHRPVRLGLVVTDWKDVRVRLTAFLESSPDGPTVSESSLPVKPVFVFPGQGSQWVGMGKTLYIQDPTFRQAIDQCEQALSPWVSWSLTRELNAAPEESRFNEIDVIQPVLFALQVAYASYWRSRGIEPAAVVGHSMGEVAAACVAGIISLDEATRIICLRSRLMRQTSGNGAMAVVELSAEEAAALISGHERGVSVAVSNSPRSTVLSGSPDVLEQLMIRLESDGVFCRKVNVDAASHSPQMDEIRLRLETGLGQVTRQNGIVDFFSTVTGELLDGDQLDAAYWGNNLRQPVLFAPVIRRMHETGYQVFLEMSPHPVLLQAIRENIPESRPDIMQRCVTIPSGRRDQNEQQVLHESLAGCYEAGLDFDWRAVFNDEYQVVPLPAFPWQRERIWYDDILDRRRETVDLKQNGGHPLLGPCFQGAGPGQPRFWEFDFDLDRFPWLADHQVKGITVLPGAFFLSCIVTALSEIGRDSIELRNVELLEALILHPGITARLQVRLEEQSDRTFSFEMYGRTIQDPQEEFSWIRHVIGSAVTRTNTIDPPISPCLVPQIDRLERGSDKVYARLGDIGLEYGPAFRVVQNVSFLDGGSHFLFLPAEDIPDHSIFRIHPILLDGCLQSCLIAKGDDHQDTLVPTRVGALHLNGIGATTDKACNLESADVFFSVGKASESAKLVGYDAVKRPCIVLEDITFRPLELEQDQPVERYEIDWIEKARSSPDQNEIRSWWIIGDHGDNLARTIGAALEERGAVCRYVSYDECLGDTVIPDNIPSGYLATTKERFGLVLFDSFIPLESGESLDQIAVECTVQFLAALQKVPGLFPEIAPRLWFITRGVYSTDPTEKGGLISASARGLFQTFRTEHPEFDCTTIDLDSDEYPGQVESILEELTVEGDEDQVVLRNVSRLVPRLVPSSGKKTTEATNHPVNAGENYRLVQSDPGKVDGLIFESARRIRPAAGEIEVELESVGLNFRDVLLALGMEMGQRPDREAGLGDEASGRITAVGPDITSFRPGDEVIVLSPSLERRTLFTRYITVDRRFVFRKPVGWSVEEAAGLPIVFLTVYYALHHRAGLKKSERILIHSGAGGVGLAAIQWAQFVGARVVATAGTPEKREYLRHLGVEHVFDSHSLAFVSEIRKLTTDEGVDVVLNSLSGDALLESIELLSPTGRFVELGRRDIYEKRQVELFAFRENRSLVTIDLAGLIETSPGYVLEMMEAVMDLVERKVFTPLPTQAFETHRISEAFHYMGRGKHIGKIAVRMKDEGIVVREARERLKEDAQYLVTGGTGALGLAVTRRMIQMGARNITLVSRTARLSDEVLADLLKSGARITVKQADLSCREEVQELITKLAASNLPLKGIVHAAGVLGDRMIARLTAQDIREVMAPKVTGAWWLHELSGSFDLDFFVLFSSVASVLGLPGQGNYVAANCFLDRLAHVRKSMGKPATSINWGPWSGIGLAAVRKDRGHRLDGQGIRNLSVDAGLAAFQEVMSGGYTQVVVCTIDADRWLQQNPGIRPFLFEQLRAASENLNPAAEAPSIVDDIRGAGSERSRRSILETYLREQAAAVLRTPQDRLNPNSPLRLQGMDSLMSLELRNRLEKGLKLKLASTLVWNYPTITVMCDRILEMLYPGSGKVDQPKTEPIENKRLEEADVLKMSDQEVEEKLLLKLTSLGFNE